MSGGVDSSVAAALLKEQGYDVVGMMLKLWSDGDSGRANRCCTPADVDAARSIANQLAIPFYLINIADSFKATVVDYFVDEYVAGRTPNPCLMCNRHIRYELLLNKALSLGAQYLATGHYARVRQVDGRVSTAARRRSAERSVVCVERAGAAGIGACAVAAGRNDQAAGARTGGALQVVCRGESGKPGFVLSRQRRLSRFSRRGMRPPDRSVLARFATRPASVLGQHHGLPFYTIGQRKGIGLAASEPLYVIALDAADNAVIVGAKHELGRRSIAQHATCTT